MRLYRMTRAAPLAMLWFAGSAVEAQNARPINPGSSIERDRHFAKPCDGQQLLAAIRAALTPGDPKPAEE